MSELLCEMLDPEHLPLLLAFMEAADTTDHGGRPVGTVRGDLMGRAFGFTGSPEERFWCLIYDNANEAYRAALVIKARMDWTALPEILPDRMTISSIAGHHVVWHPDFRARSAE